MRIQFALAKVAQGVFNADDAAVALNNSGHEVTNELYDQLRKAEKSYHDAKNWPQTDDIVLVAGANGNPDFTANYRGKHDGLAVVVFNQGCQMSVPFSQISKLPA